MMSGYRIGPTLPASDLERAKTWYREKLGLTPVSEDAGGVEYELESGTGFALYPSRFAGTAQNTAAGFRVGEDLEKVIDELTARGVVFEQYDLPDLKTDAKGIADVGETQGAWFKDSEGNILALEGRS